jgi:hypothetical protein
MSMKISSDKDARRTGHGPYVACIIIGCYPAGQLEIDQRVQDLQKKAAPKGR